MKFFVVFSQQLYTVGSWNFIGSFHTSWCVKEEIIIKPPLFREGAILQSPCLSVSQSVCPSVRTDISASTGGIDFKFCTQLILDELQDHLCFQVCRTSTSCLAGRLRLFFRLKIRMFKFFVTDFSASTGGNDFKFYIKLQHDELYCASPFQVCRRSTSCLPSRHRQFSA